MKLARSDWKSDAKSASWRGRCKEELKGKKGKEKKKRKEKGESVKRQKRLLERKKRRKNASIARRSPSLTR